MVQVEIEFPVQEAKRLLSPQTENIFLAVYLKITW